MYVGISRIVIYLPASQSLKDKRQVVKSIVARLKNKDFSVAEVGFLDLHQKAEIGIAFVSNDKNFAEEMCLKAVNFIEDNYPVEILSVEMDITS